MLSASLNKTFPSFLPSRRRKKSGYKGKTKRIKEEEEEEEEEEEDKRVPTYKQSVIHGLSLLAKT